jgi:hypothetical protein
MDPVQQDDPLYAGGANGISLLVARGNYARFGACNPELASKVRSPRLDEVPGPYMVRDLESADCRRAVIRGIKTVILGIVNAMLSGEISTFDGCSAVASVGWPLVGDELAEDLCVLEAVADEMDVFPHGEARKFWAPKALELKDAEAAEYERRINGMVQNACQALKTRLERELGGNQFCDSL